jgi:uncharacterized protein (UPF0276 family)
LARRAWGLGRRWRWRWKHLCKARADRAAAAAAVEVAEAADAEAADAEAAVVVEGAAVEDAVEISSYFQESGRLGIGWRPEVAVMTAADPALKFIEVTGEHFLHGALPATLDQLADEGRILVPHGISVSLGSAEGVNLEGVKLLERLARRFGSPFVSEHVAFVRAGDREAGHLLPVPRTKGALNVLVENIQKAQELLSVPLALENISALFAWPEADYSDGEFLSELLHRTGCLLLLDTSNVYANARNLGSDAAVFLDQIPLERLAYVHVGGGVEDAEGVYHDSHAHAVTEEALGVLEALCARREPPAVMLERDDAFPTEAELRGELARIRAAMERGQARRRVTGHRA